MFDRILTYLRCFFWVPTGRTRTIIVLRVPHEEGEFRVLETQRLYFGRWGRLKWRTIHRFARVPADIA